MYNIYIVCFKISTLKSVHFVYKIRVFCNNKCVKYSYVFGFDSFNYAIIPSIA